MGIDGLSGRAAPMLCDRRVWLEGWPKEGCGWRGLAGGMWLGANPPEDLWEAGPDVSTIDLSECRDGWQIQRKSGVLTRWHGTARQQMFVAEHAAGGLRSNNLTHRATEDLGQVHRRLRIHCRGQLYQTSANSTRLKGQFLWTGRTEFEIRPEAP